MVVASPNPGVEKQDDVTSKGSGTFDAPGLAVQVNGGLQPTGVGAISLSRHTAMARGRPVSSLSRQTMARGRARGGKSFTVSSTANRGNPNENRAKEVRGQWHCCNRGRGIIAAGLVTVLTS